MGKRWRRKGRRGPKPTRHLMWYLQDGICAYCDLYFDPADFTVDHVRPQSKGGPDTMANAVGSCVPCNAAKADDWPDEEMLARVMIRNRWTPLQPLGYHTPNVLEVLGMDPGDLPVCRVG